MNANNVIFKPGTLVEFVEYRHRLRLHPPPLPHLRPHLRLLPRLLPRDDIGFVLEFIPKAEVFENYLESDPNCVVVHWMRIGEQYLMYEDEIVIVPSLT